MNIFLENFQPLSLNNGFALSSFTFQFPKRYLIVAPSGRGKTTLLHCIYQIRKDYKGKIAFSKTIPSLTILWRNHLSIVFQDLRLFPHLTLWENLQIKRVFHPHLVKESQLLEWLDFLSLADLRFQRVEHLSLGQQQRVALLRSFLQPMDWLLLDEPFSHVDEATAQKMAILIEAILKERQAGCMITALQSSSPLSCDFCYVL